MGVNSVPSTVSPCSTHCLPSCQWTKVCVCVGGGGGGVVWALRYGEDVIQFVSIANYCLQKSKK